MNQTNQQDYQDLYQNGPQPPSKKHTGCVIAVVVGGVCFVIIAVLVAILVPAMIGYTRKSYAAQANQTAKLCFNTAQVTLTEMDETKEVEDRTYIVTNIAGWEDYNAPEDASELEYAVDDALYAADDKYYYYFIVVDGADVTYTAVKSIQHDKALGSYPRASSDPGTVVGYDGNEVDITDTDMTYLQLYKDAIRMIGGSDGEDNDD